MRSTRVTVAKPSHQYVVSAFAIKGGHDSTFNVRIADGIAMACMLVKRGVFPNAHNPRHTIKCIAWKVQ
jgi:hypothetical protein